MSREFWIVEVSSDAWRNTGGAVSYYFSTQRRAVAFREWAESRPGVSGAASWPISTSTLAEAKSDLSGYDLAWDEDPRFGGVL
jgi:hypothetical protein